MYTHLKNNENNNLYGLRIYIAGITQLLSDIRKNEGKIHIISGNAEVLKYPITDKNTYRLFNTKMNIIIPDGISVYYPMKLKNKFCHKIPGIELMEKIILECNDTGKAVYFVGAKEDVVEKMVEKFACLYPKLEIAGYHHGYFDKENCNSIILDIKKSQPYALFVALGTPAQENFIFKYIEELPCSVFMGVGGSFDVFSGVIERSPKWMCNLGIEWLYRLIKDPSKANRFFNNILFTMYAFLRG